jgi:hypothetical protein
MREEDVWWTGWRILRKDRGYETSAADMTRPNMATARLVVCFCMNMGLPSHLAKLSGLVRSASKVLSFSGQSGVHLKTCRGHDISEVVFSDEQELAAYI